MLDKLKQLLAVLKKYSGMLKALFLFSILLFVVNQMTGILQGMTWSELQTILFSQPKKRLLLMVVTGLVAVLPMMTYDWVTVEILAANGKKRLPRKHLLTSAWTTNTLNNLAGFGGVIGATLRARFYGGDGVSSKKTIATVSKVALFMLTGLSFLCLITVVDIYLFRTTNPFRNYWVWLLGGSLFAPAIIGFIYLNQQKLFKDFTTKRIIKLFLGSLGQWLGALISFLLIGQLLGVEVSSFTVYPLFIAATFIGMISMVPGGMGTFDVIMIVGLGTVGVSKELAVAWLLYYRIFYYLVPFLTGVYSFVHQMGSKVNEFFDGIPKLITQKAAHLILVGMVYFAGIMMILLSTIPNLSNISQIFQKLLPFSFNFLDQSLNMLVGFLLLGLARGVSNRVKKAYFPTMLVLAFCIFNTISRTFSWQLLIFYAFLVACLFLARKEFYRKQLVFSWESLAVDGALYGGLFILYSIVGYYASEKIGHGKTPANFLLFPSETVWIQGFAGLLLAAATIAILYDYLGGDEELGEAYQADKVSQFITQYGSNDYSHLFSLGDKQQFYYQPIAEAGVMFNFERKGSYYFVLGDPIGAEALIVEASQKMMEKADYLGFRLVFYGITDRYALILHDLGYDFMKVGEKGFVKLSDLPETTINDWQEADQMVGMLESGYRFETVKKPLSDDLMGQLEEISAEWLAGHEERYFSFGRFNREMVSQSNVGLVFDGENKLVGFISETLPQNKTEVGYSLMRYRDDVPDGIDHFLMTHLIQQAKSDQLSGVSLGLSPLVKVGEAKSSFFKERLINMLYTYSNPQASFKDTHQFKENYASEWQPRYLSFQKSTNSLFLIAQTYRLVVRNSGRKNSPIKEFYTNE
ncbi:bifunctional lysylphosphatidylglycerol flippase/synthetase MprF [Vagococcus coleopterorum]|uniref:Phosphatidylglycerol lysyltransferase n=1 Tax=Vagococcus coleopterorum TaxID=2714946 RepID=A0A6G8AL08_9ENTE|nr:bifunctional lysylphosphatidylglycerol flippase/synthetase MprF [Vagococcus coleopterorum]QIL45686.1 bifunctional lysylphosphatidylglycerol flippase/synthetase MprF [Vagococcus coleopterorum]